MKKDLPMTVFLPESYKTGTNRYPVVYFLHWAGGHYDTFHHPKSKLRTFADLYNVIIVCPEGTPYGWWLDSPLDPSMKYESFVVKEVVPHMDKNYRTLPERTQRGITGGSMGGHGAWYLGLRHRDTFGVVGAVYGGVDLRPYPNRWQLSKILGTLKDHPENWRDHSVVTLAKGLKNKELDLIAIVGTQDIFIGPNRNLHKILTQNKVAHTYIEVQGENQVYSSHSIPFGIKSFPIMFRFISNYFKEGQGHL